jgi:chemotaxis-related protein WspD
MTDGEARRLPVVDDCWNRIGVRGDRSCPELTTALHCHNCRVFARAADSLLDRPADAAYLAERAGALAEPVVSEDKTVLAAIVFDVGGEAFALESKRVLEVTEARGVHRVPHRSNGVFRGLVNVHGQLDLCFSLSGLLGIEDRPGDANDALRIVVAELGGERAVFSVDHVRGVRRFAQSSFRDAPATSVRRALPFVQSMVADGDDRIGVLDPDALRAGFEGSLR